MLVKELIKALEIIDPDKKVIVRTSYYDTLDDNGLEKFYNDYEIAETDIYEDDNIIYLGDY